MGTQINNYLKDDDFDGDGGMRIMRKKNQDGTDGKRGEVGGKLGKDDN